MSALEHPHKREIAALRDIILDADSSISEGIKWNAPSYRTTEYFATTHLRAKLGVGIILHLGARKREGIVKIDDPTSLLTWLAKDRAVVAFENMADVKAKRASFQAIIRQWIGHVA